MRHFCDQNGDVRVLGCEVRDEHIHLLCAACKYPWVERCLDQAMLAEAAGEMVAESELAAALASIAATRGGISFSREAIYAHRGWTLRFERTETTIVVSAEPAAENGKPQHLEPAMFQQEGQ